MFTECAHVYVICRRMCKICDVQVMCDVYIDYVICMVGSCVYVEYGVCVFVEWSGVCVCVCIVCVCVCGVWCVFV